jgi:L-lactate dehydrogenase complex protein LldG
MSDPISARAEILRRIRSANRRDAAAQNADEMWEAIPRSYRQTGALDRAGCIDLFAERLLDYGAGVSRCLPAEVAATIAGILHGRNREKMLVSPDIDPAWLLNNAGCTFIADDALSYAAIEACDGVLTGCVVGIAGTGTLGLCHETTGQRSSSQESTERKPLQGRRALTLIPDYHLCVVRASDVVETVPEAMRVLELHKLQAITLVSGPSATADIEMTRIQGVHGPRVLDVVIVA